jgi:hypothetical protein
VDELAPLGLLQHLCAQAHRVIGVRRSWEIAASRLERSIM